MSLGGEDITPFRRDHFSPIRMRPPEGQRDFPYAPGELLRLASADRRSREAATGSWTRPAVEGDSGAHPACSVRLKIALKEAVVGADGRR